MIVIGPGEGKVRYQLTVIGLGEGKVRYQLTVIGLGEGKVCYQLIFIGLGEGRGGEGTLSVAQILTLIRATMWLLHC